MIGFKNKFTERMLSLIRMVGILHRMNSAKIGLSLAVMAFTKVFRCRYCLCVKILLTIVMLHLFSATIRGQQIRFDQMSIEEGLSSNSIYTIFQDSYGVIWVGTLDGLNRYDGYEIKVFKHDNLKKRSLSNNRTTQIYEDRRHQLWLYDEFSSIMTRYIRDKDEFSSYYLDKIVGADLRTLDSLYENDEGKLCIRSIDGYYLQFNEGEDNFEFIKSDTIRMLAWQRENKWTRLLKAFNRYLVNSKSTFDSNTIGIRKIIKDSQGRCWIATRYDGLYSAIENNEFEFVSHRHTTEKDKYINSEDIHDIYEDRSSVVWIGTKNSGLYRYSRHKYKFDQISDLQSSSGALHLGTLRAITQDARKNIWIGTNDQGLIRIDPSGKTGKLYKPRPGDPTSVGHRFIRALWTDEKQNVWIGHYNGFSRYRPDTDNFVQYFPRSESKEEIRVYDFKKGEGNKIWMAGWDVILRFDRETKQYDIISRSDSRELKFSNDNIRDLELDDEGQLEMAVGEKGISLYDKVKNQFITVRYIPSSAKGLPSNNIFDVFKDGQGNVWLATADGLCHLDPERLTCETFTTNEGLPSNLVYGILEDKKGNLWFSTTKGISKFDVLHNVFRNYSVSDGLQSNEFTENAFYQNGDGVMFFGGINGLNFFHPDSVVDNPYTPQVAITRLKVFDQPLSEVAVFSETDLNEKLKDQKTIVLTPDQRSVSFEFVAYHYVNPQKNRYAFMLEGFDESWTYRDANVRFANYTNLEPGKYVFRIRASNSDGIWSDDTRLIIVIEQPFYTSQWFVITGTILLTTLGVFLYRWRIATVKRQQSKKSIQLESELNFLKSQVNPHFLFNTLNNIYALCQVNSRNAAPMVGKISEMMRYMIYDCTSDLVPLQKELDYLNNYIDLNQLKSNRKLNASIEVIGNPDGLKIAPLLLINFLENSFKHGDLNQNGDGFIKVRLAIQGLGLSFSVSNSFRDSPTAKREQTGIGLDNVKHRLSLLYPGRYSLRIDKNNSIFEVELELRLD
jgi:ligand-binding sensor domain-containing protein